MVPNPAEIIKENLEADLYDKSVFIAISYSDSTLEVHKSLKESLEEFGLKAKFAKDATLNPEIWNNAHQIIKTCKYSIAVFDNADLNDNVLFESGVLTSRDIKENPWLLLKEQSILQLPTNLKNFKYKEYDNSNTKNSIRTAILEWVTDLKISSTLEAVQILKARVSLDFKAREAKINNANGHGDHDYFMIELGRCNVGKRYIYRKKVVESTQAWLQRADNTFLLLTGPSGIGKTNFLLMELLVPIMAGVDKSAISEHYKSIKTVILLPLGSYVYSENQPFLENLTKFINHKRTSNESFIHESIVKELISSTSTLLILDGLDEFVRSKSENACMLLLAQLKESVGFNGARVIMSCRHHIYKRLTSNDAFKSYEIYEIELPEIDSKTVERVISEWLSEIGSEAEVDDILRTLHSNPAFLSLLKNPLMLDMICDIPGPEWKDIISSNSNAKLYETWFKKLISSTLKRYKQQDGEHVDTNDVFSSIAAIAERMLKNRKDLISLDELAKLEIPFRFTLSLSTKSIGLFIQQTEKNWGFVHDSFREFSLAYGIYNELKTTSFNLLSSTNSFDYVGAETYAFLYGLINSSDTFFTLVNKALNAPNLDNQEWNNIIRNCFEAIGMIGDEQCYSFIDKALEMLQVPEDASNPVLPRTKYNIVRAVERLHDSAPHLYFQHVLQKDWKLKSTFYSFHAFAIRGFHLKHPEPGIFPPLEYFYPRNNFASELQKKVSKKLMDLMVQAAGCRLANKENPSFHDYEHLEINCSFALIRWFFRGHLNDLRNCLETVPLHPKTKGNLFMALTRFRKPELFKEFKGLFYDIETTKVLDFSTTELLRKYSVDVN
ncbi:MAG: NACHT domain-containing protein [Candidatus Brocadiaceae bacterium]|nr:NACHT domain-containing protein [Candidatus Brocadiaceae bacterium]